MRLVPLPRLCICDHITDHSCFFPYSFSSYLMVICFVTRIILGLRKETKLLKISALWSLYKVQKRRRENTRGLVSSQSLVKALTSAELQSCLDVKLLFLGDTELECPFLVTSTWLSMWYFNQGIPVSEKGQLESCSQSKSMAFDSSSLDYIFPYLGWKDLLGEGMATYSSILAWRILVDRGA